MSKKISGAEHPLSKIFSLDFDYHIPSYQRPYAWEVDQVSELFDDLYDFQKTEDEEGYFLGSIVLIKKEDKPDSEVIDGQQRLTTLTILLATLASQLNGNDQETIQKYIIEPGNKFQELEAKPRLTLRERDKEFFKQYVQNLAFDDLLKIDKKNLDNESQINIQANSKYFIDRIKKEFSSDVEGINNFVKFLLNRCFLVTVSTPSQQSAFRVFSVMNSRGLDLQDTDIIKADVIGKISPEQQDEYNKRWEGIEINLGRDEFNKLFSYIRMIYAKEKAKKALLDEFRQYVLNETEPEELLEKILEPFALALSTVKNSSFQATSDADETNTYLQWLNTIDNSDWIPVAILFISQQRNNPKYVLWFFKKLERLAAYLHICSKNVNHRINRYGKIITELKGNHSLEQLISTIELNNEEQEEMKAALDGNIYELTPRRRNYIILRLDSFLSDGGASYNSTVLTIEHVLPQTINENSEWAKLWPDVEKQQKWVHRIANLVPLNKQRNSQAQNYDFERKKSAYFKGDDNVSSYCLTTQVLYTNTWNEEDLKKRQYDLLNVMFKKWELLNDDDYNDSYDIKVEETLTTDYKEEIKPTGTIGITIKGISLPLPKNEGGEFQKDFRKLINTLFNYQLLSNKEIGRLYEKEYSKRMLGINFPLFSKNRFVSERSRYWKDKIHGHYVCSEWALPHFEDYRDKMQRVWFPYLKNINK
ncbi:MAG: DUF262 domain-containing HNH endonuclease family protein [Proteobacteria bacterium]|nr:DUF262 domain-containing HNH endonuclease family protein [Pseudomonadota bacterium]